VGWLPSRSFAEISLSFAVAELAELLDQTGKLLLELAVHACSYGFSEVDQFIKHSFDNAMVDDRVALWEMP
jgi:hypothetical protein